MFVPAGDLRGRLVRLLGFLEPPLLLICDGGDEDDSDHGIAGQEVIESPSIEGSSDSRRVCGDARREEEDVGRRGYHEEQEGLRQGDEDDVEEEEEGGRDVFAQNLPAIVFGTDAIATFAEVVECQAALFLGNE